MKLTPQEKAVNSNMATFDNITNIWFDQIADWALLPKNAVNKEALLKIVKMVPNRKNLIKLMSEINGYRFDEDKNAIRVPLPNLYKHCQMVLHKEFREYRHQFHKKHSTWVCSATGTLFSLVKQALEYGV